MSSPQNPSDIRAPRQGRAFLWTMHKNTHSAKNTASKVVLQSDDTPHNAPKRTHPVSDVCSDCFGTNSRPHARSNADRLLSQSLIDTATSYTQQAHNHPAKAPVSGVNTRCPSRKIATE